MLRSITALVIAVFIATAGPALARPQFTPPPPPTLTVINDTGGAATVELAQQGVVKATLVFYPTTRPISVRLTGSFTMTGTVIFLHGKSVSITPRDVTLEFGPTIYITVAKNILGRYIFKNGSYLQR